MRAKPCHKHYSWVRIWFNHGLLHFALIRSQGEMYIGHARLSVPRYISALLHGRGCNLGEW